MPGKVLFGSVLLDVILRQVDAEKGVLLLRGAGLALHCHLPEAQRLLIGFLILGEVAVLHTGRIAVSFREPLLLLRSVPRTILTGFTLQQLQLALPSATNAVPVPAGVGIVPAALLAGCSIDLVVLIFLKNSVGRIRLHLLDKRREQRVNLVRSVGKDGNIEMRHYIFLLDYGRSYHRSYPVVLQVEIQGQ